MSDNMVPDFDDTGWPMVVPQDNGLRPAGDPDKCFYCGQSIGQPHRRRCVVVEKKIKVQYIIEDEIMVPHFWTAEDFEAHRNYGFWCADNAMDAIKAKIAKADCACGILRVKFASVVDPTPFRPVKTEEQRAMDKAMRDLLG